MTHALVVGKFLPPHAGHHRLIDAALAAADRVTVTVFGRAGEPIDAELRAAWLREIHPRARVLTGHDDHPIDWDDDELYDLHTAEITALCPERVDLVVSGEPHAAKLARRLGAEVLLLERDGGISGTAVRADPAAHWEALSAPVRAHYVTRVALVGAESTGTTTLTRALAEHFGTVWVPEYGRTFSEERLREGRFGEWSHADFLHIARTQAALEDEAARHSGPLLFCDTDPLATCIWQERYLGTSTSEVEAIAAGRRYALYLLTDHEDVPFAQDGVRDGEHLRPWMTRRFERRLPPGYVKLTGPAEERLQAALEAITRSTSSAAADTSALTSSAG